MVDEPELAPDAPSNGEVGAAGPVRSWLRDRVMALFINDTTYLTVADVVDELFPWTGEGGPWTANQLRAHTVSVRSVFQSLQTLERIEPAEESGRKTAAASSQSSNGDFCLCWECPSTECSARRKC